MGFIQYRSTFDKLDTTCATSCHHHVCDLPLELFYWVQEYVNINQLLLTSSRMSRHWYQLYRWHLNARTSKRYLVDPSPGLQCMDSPARQLRMHVSGDRDLVDMTALGNVHTLELHDCQSITDVSALRHVHTLTISDCQGVSDVSAVGNVRTVTLRHCQLVMDWPY